MKKIISIFLLAMIFSFGFSTASEAKLKKFESSLIEPQEQFNVYLESDESSAVLGYRLAFSKGDKNNYWVFSPSSPPQINIDSYTYQPTNYYHKSGPSQYGGYHSYAALNNLSIDVLQKIVNAKQISITLFFTNQDTLFINVPQQILDEWKTLIELSWKG
ncbi:MAG: hypothetical protein H6Q72_1419 [Firmicutes bacterium]|nr:hypothetical protein [Bacillota bacterium]